MSAIKDINMARGIGYIGRVLYAQQSDPLCGGCRAFAKSASEAREAMAALKASAERLPTEYRHLADEALRALEGLRIPDEPASQRKEGRCALPEKACLVKHSKSIFELIYGQWKEDGRDNNEEARG